MLGTVLSRKALSDLFRQRLTVRGEEVWDWSVVVRERRFFEPLLWTTKLANDFVRLTLPNEPEGWAVESVTPDEWRLYLRVGESYDETGARHFRPPVQLEVKSPDEFIRLRALPREQWWEAAFVCPFCDQLCTGDSKCLHLIVSHGQAVEALWGTPLDLLLRDMTARRFSCNLLNRGVEGLVVKLPRRFYSWEWFRSACIFAARPSVIDAAADLLKDAKGRS